MFMEMLVNTLRFAGELLWIYGIHDNNFKHRMSSIAGNFRIWETRVRLTKKNLIFNFLKMFWS